MERALAWGWATHVLGDIWIHPLINQATAEHVSGQRSPGLTYADDPINHVRVEIGLDASLPAVRNWPVPDLDFGLNPGGQRNREPYALRANLRTHLRTFADAFRMASANRVVQGFSWVHASSRAARFRQLPEHCIAVWPRSYAS